MWGLHATHAASSRRRLLHPPFWRVALCLAATTRALAVAGLNTRPTLVGEEVIDGVVGGGGVVVGGVFSGCIVVSGCVVVSGIVSGCVVVSGVFIFFSLQSLALGVALEDVGHMLRSGVSEIWLSVAITNNAIREDKDVPGELCGGDSLGHRPGERWPPSLPPEIAHYIFNLMFHTNCKSS